jgi:hypothetical protein
MSSLVLFQCLIAKLTQPPDLLDVVCFVFARRIVRHANETPGNGLSSSVSSGRQISGRGSPLRVVVSSHGEKGDPILRTAFQDERFTDISGLIWSRRSPGNFLGQADDLVYVHNQVARKPIPRKWARWAEEFYPIDEGKKLRARKRRK